MSAPVPANPDPSGTLSSRELLAAFLDCAVAQTAVDSAGRVRERCGVVAAVTGASEEQLRTLLPAALAVVHGAVDRRLLAEGVSSNERESALSLLRTSAAALREAAAAISAARAEWSLETLRGGPVSADAVETLRASQGVGMLLQFAQSGGASEDDRAKAQAIGWIIASRRTRAAAGLSVPLRAAAMDPVLLLFFGLRPPPPSLRDADQGWFQYITWAAARIAPEGWLEVPQYLAQPDVRGRAARQAHAAVLGTMAERTLEAASKLRDSELERTTRDEAEALARAAGRGSVAR